MAQWIGDGELVGVRTKFILTLSNDVTLSTPGYKSAYFTPVSCCFFTVFLIIKYLLNTSIDVLEAFDYSGQRYNQYRIQCS
jgi:hypothetical protein